MTLQYFSALSIVIAYGVLCWFFLWRCKTRPNLNDISDNTLLVAYASQSGQAEQLAKQYANVIQENQSVVLVSLNQVDSHLIEKASLALFIVSTYGEGEPPDNALRFQQQWLRNSPKEKLSHLRYAVLALGDSEYQQYCQFGVSLGEQLQQHGAAPLFDTIKVDKLDANHLAIWQQQLLNHGLINSALSESTTSTSTTPSPEFSNGMLIEQKCINSGSPGAPACFVRIKPPSDCDWQAGDIVEIQPYNDSKKPTREYSIASLPSDGSIDLLVRQVCKQDGSFGMGSGWLTKDAELSNDISLRIRSNSAFHPPAANTPIILIGNGTGIAGLRALLKARILSGSKQNCLFFGERTRAHDFFFSGEIEHWQKNGFLPHIHLAFSRDQNNKRYVQDLVIKESKFISNWIKQGAAIYVCGSLDGMAGGVNTALENILGLDTVIQLKADGRYRRDVY